MKLKILIFAICIFAIGLIQSTVLDYIKICNIKPNLLIVFIISFALARGHIEGAVIGFFSGIIQDMISGKVLGFYSLMGLYLGLAVGSVNKRLYRDNLVVAVFITFISTVIYEFAVYILITFIKGQMDLLYAIRGLILPEALYNSIFSVFIYLFVTRINAWFEEREKSSRKY